MSRIHIGISGWRYAPWRGVFYPRGLAQQHELEFASRAVSSIEINGSFYSLQRPTSYAAWAAATPDDFIFSVKGGRFITHMKRLRDVDEALANFFASGLFCLGPKLGPILWQFPANFRMDKALFDKFLCLLPRDTTEASKLARKCSARMRSRSALEPDATRPLRHAVEIRNPEGLDAEFVELLRHHNVALVVADTAGKWPFHEDITANLVYIRLHGDLELYHSGYSDTVLEHWKRRIQSWSKGVQPSDATLIAKRKKPDRRPDVFCYFDNDAKVCAPFDAWQLLNKLGLTDGLQERPGEAVQGEYLLGVNANKQRKRQSKAPQRAVATTRKRDSKQAPHGNAAAPQGARP